MSTSAQEISAYRAAIEAEDPKALAAACAPDLVFNSPITSSFKFEGPGEMENLYRTVLSVYDDQEFVAEYECGDTRIVHLRAHIRGQELDEVQILRLNDEGKVREITMYVRPMPGLTALAARLGPRLAGQQAAWRKPLLAALSRPLAAATRLGEKTGVRLVRPRR